jgi:hypothetical protein
MRQPLFPGDSEIDEIFRIFRCVPSPRRSLLHRYRHLPTAVLSCAESKLTSHARLQSSRHSLRGRLARCYRSPRLQVNLPDLAPQGARRPRHGLDRRERRVDGRTLHSPSLLSLRDEVLTTFHNNRACSRTTRRSVCRPRLRCSATTSSARRGSTSVSLGPFPSFPHRLDSQLQLSLLSSFTVPSPFTPSLPLVDTPVALSSPSPTHLVLLFSHASLPRSAFRLAFHVYHSSSS